MLALSFLLMFAAPDERGRELHDTERELLRPCKDGVAEACRELLDTTRSALRSAPDTRTRRRYANVLVRLCKAHHEPSCKALVQTGEAFLHGDTVEEGKRGAKLLRRACRYAPDQGCPAALRVARELIDSPRETAEHRVGLSMLRHLCGDGIQAACDVESQRGASQGMQIAGEALSYTGLASTLVGAGVWGLYFPFNRCDTMGRGVSVSLMMCGMGWGLYGTGSALSIVGSYLTMHSGAESQAADASAYYYLGITMTSLGIVTPLAVDAWARDADAVVAWSPLGFAAMGQLFFFLARLSDPEPEALAWTVTPMWLPESGGAHGLALNVDW